MFPVRRKWIRIHRNLRSHRKYPPKPKFNIRRIQLQVCDLSFQAFGRFLWSLRNIHEGRRFNWVTAWTNEAKFSSHSICLDLAHIFHDEDLDGLLKMLRNFYELQNLSLIIFPQKLPVRQDSASEGIWDGVTNCEMDNLSVSPLEPPWPTSQENDSETINFQTSDHPNHTDNNKRSSSVVNYFRDWFFRVDISQSINSALRDYDVCSEKFDLFEHKTSVYFSNILSSPAPDFFFDNYVPKMSFRKIETMMMK